jgi:probable rRNA maturation factor
MPKLKLAVQYASELSPLPSRAQLRSWVKAALRVDTEVTIRLVDEAEGRALNKHYRGKDYATNVLTFPLSAEPHLICDIIICAPVVASEAMAQGKTLIAHYAHLTVHGILHLHGYDHENDAQAGLMESIETAIVTKLGYADPYLIT